MGHSGFGAPVYGDEEIVLVSCADLVQDRIARAGIVWPRGRAGGFLSPTFNDGVASWVGHDGERAAIGSLPGVT